MNPDTYHDGDDELSDGSESPLDNIARQLAAGPRRERWMTDEQWDLMPGRLPAESLAEWHDRQRAYVERLRAERRIARAEARRQEALAAAAAGLPPPVKPLTRRQQRFCELFVVIGNASEAARQAGYQFADSRNRGYRLLRRPDIQARIGELQRGLARNLNVDAEVMLGRLESAYHLAIEGEYYNAAARLVEVQARIAGHLAAARAKAPAAKDDDR